MNINNFCIKIHPFLMFCQHWIFFFCLSYVSVQLNPFVECLCTMTVNHLLFSQIATAASHNYSHTWKSFSFALYDKLIFNALIKTMLSHLIYRSFVMYCTYYNVHLHEKKVNLRKNIFNMFYFSVDHIQYRNLVIHFYLKMYVLHFQP